MTNIIQCLLSSICITIPEYIFLIIITFRMMGRKEMLDYFNLKDNLISIMKIITFPAILLNILNYILKTPSDINKIISYIVLYLLLIYILNTEKYSYIEYPKLKQKAFGCLFLGIIICFAIEAVTYPLITKLVGKTYDEIKLNISLVIICSLASRIINVVILIYLFIKRNAKYQFNLRDYIFHNNFFRRVSICLIISLLIFEMCFIKLLLNNNLVIHNIYGQLFLIIGVTFLIPGLAILLIYSCLYFCVTIITSEKTDCQ